MPEEIKSHCRVCEGNTQHDVLCEHKESYREEYSCDFQYQVIRCKGCLEVSFRKVFADVEGAFPIGEDSWDVPTEITVFPKFVKGHSHFSDINEVPPIVRTVYQEVLLAVQEDAKVLAGLGLRGTVEAVCNEQGIAGKSLDVRINKLVSAGLISKNDADRLHAIRFMGNDAAHDIKAPSRNAISVALDIVEHMIKSVYILEKKANGTLETALSRYDNFEQLLTEKLDAMQSGDEIPLAKIFGKDIRRIKDSLTLLEQELIRRINDGTFAKLKIGKQDHYQGSPTRLQHFVVV